MRNVLTFVPMTDSDWLELPNFTKEEFECSCCGEANMDKEFMKYLQELRTFVGAPFVINSGYRCKKYNKKIGGRIPHTTGKAVDIGINGKAAYELIREAMIDGVRVGVKQHGPRPGRFVHIDTLHEGEYKGVTSPILWTYK